MRGSIWRCANEQLRPATNDESLGNELVNRFFNDMRTDVIRGRGPKKFVDVRAEGRPNFPGDPVEEEEELPPQSDPSEDEEPEPMAQDNDLSPLPSEQQPQSEPSRIGTPDSEHHGPSVSVIRPEGHAGARVRSRTPPRDETRTAQPGTPISTPNIAAPARSLPPFPYPFDRGPSEVSYNAYIEATDDTSTFFVSEACAEFDESQSYFTVKKKPVDAEIAIDSLTETAYKLFTGPGGSRHKEWENMVSQVKKEGGPAVRVHRGARAR
jgi:hypothetical protein